jgi:hypothetical protein
MNKDIGMKRTMILLALVFGVAAIIYYVKINDKPIEQEAPDCNTEGIWIPTKEDIAYQDSMYNIIQNTQSDVDTIKVRIEYILKRLDYDDGTYDSIRYPDENVMWITGDGDTIWE